MRIIGHIVEKTYHYSALIKCARENNLVKRLYEKSSRTDGTFAETRLSDELKIT